PHLKSMANVNGLKNMANEIKKPELSAETTQYERYLTVQIELDGDEAVTSMELM
ncbi:Hypothetical predicted protein, partial [Scomber scombrus]